MSNDLVKAVLAVAVFVCFPFAVIAAAAGLLSLVDRLIHLGDHHHAAR